MSKSTPPHCAIPVPDRVPAIQKRIDALTKEMAYLADSDLEGFSAFEVLVAMKIEDNGKREQATIKAAAKGGGR